MITTYIYNTQFIRPIFGRLDFLPGIRVQASSVLCVGDTQCAGLLLISDALMIKLHRAGRISRKYDPFFGRIRPQNRNADNL